LELILEYLADELKIDTTENPLGGKLVSQTIWGILRGLETFVQLMAPSEDGIAVRDDLFCLIENLLIFVIFITAAR
jgi:hypothetical protein